jgi:hypothetical protein
MVKILPISEAQLLATQILASQHTFVIPKARLHHGKIQEARLASIEEVYKKIRPKILTPGSEKKCHARTVENARTVE